MDVVNWDGTLSEKDFYLAAQTFAQKWKSLNPDFPPWSWVPCRKQPLVSSVEAEGYLSLEKIFLPGSSEDDYEQDGHTGDEETSCSESEGPVDSATLVQSSNLEVHYYDFHMVYSYSFKVPVLYFRAYSGDGQPLMLDEIEKELPACSSKNLLESKWTFITQEEHPYLNRPWYKLHPCGTGEWMKLLFMGDAALLKHGDWTETYLASWLSVAGQVVGLKIPRRMLNHYYQS
ncbi:hypothetical protein SLEP1_g9029 [Rubroshorea leprosula]|uniref:Ubiquitin-like-conjugating enzyme ATG10 n=1 Tax=Rubroshorea leprosula TaxID=152421 RepID=A0AAV5IC04_9ROSI|nr:hypothetical protein SLEP1_g9029 [Rubroshorea leprosula]